MSLYASSKTALTQAAPFSEPTMVDVARRAPSEVQLRRQASQYDARLTKEKEPEKGAGEEEGTGGRTDGR